MRPTLDITHAIYIHTRPRCSWQVPAIDKLLVMLANKAFYEGVRGSAYYTTSSSASRRGRREAGEGCRVPGGIGEAVGRGRGGVSAGPIPFAVHVPYAIVESCHK